MCNGVVGVNFKHFVNISKIYAQSLKKCPLYSEGYLKCPLSSRGVKNFFIQLVLFLSKNVRYIVEGIFVERAKIVTVILVKGVMPYVN